MLPAARTLAIISIVLSGAIFGFFYAWVCSTMWGLDQADPQVAVAAMQAMNASVRNAVFFPAFFLTPVLLGLTAGAAYAAHSRAAAGWFIAAAGLYLSLGLLLTVLVNVPMNEALAAVGTPTSTDEARRAWAEYSGPWQAGNTVRTVASGVVLALAAIGLSSLHSPRSTRSAGCAT
ncbi:MAG TPA: anthrone oxygenase family protein [Pseudorhizobium sp.]|jgi:uncharacterized membrane protein|nr:anthrone oxygenase family protein [Pseudorhizobium sp.]